MPCVWQPENTEAFTLPLDKKKKYIWSINAVNFITFARFFADTFERTIFDLCVQLIQNTCHSNQLNTYLVS